MRSSIFGRILATSKNIDSRRCSQPERYKEKDVKKEEEKKEEENGRYK